MTRQAVGTLQIEAVAADMIAMVVRENGGIAERRVLLLTDLVLSGRPVFSPQGQG